jgi:hypothetical protein
MADRLPRQLVRVEVTEPRVRRERGSGSARPVHVAPPSARSGGGDDIAPPAAAAAYAVASTSHGRTGVTYSCQCASGTPSAPCALPVARQRLPAALLSQRPLPPSSTALGVSWSPGGGGNGVCRRQGRRRRCCCLPTRTTGVVRCRRRKQSQSASLLRALPIVVASALRAGARRVGGCPLVSVACVRRVTVLKRRRGVRHVPILPSPARWPCRPASGPGA